MIDVVHDGAGVLCSDSVAVRPVTSLEIAHRFALDPDLQSVARLLARAHELVITTVMPLTTMVGLLDAVDSLDIWLRRTTPHLTARRQP